MNVSFTTAITMYINVFSGPIEYCIDETFTGRCKPDEVILLKSALYGRFKVGKCVEDDTGT